MSNEGLARRFFAAKGREFNEPVDFLWRVVGGRIVAAWAYTGATKETVQIHLAAELRGLNRELIRLGLSYPFDHLGVKVILAVIPGTNGRALETARKLGFVQCGLIEEVDLLLFKMSRTQCRWILNG